MTNHTRYKCKFAGFFYKIRIRMPDYLTYAHRLKMIKIGNISLPDFPLLLAPMEDVSDPPFRAVCKDNGADLMYTEFISSEGLDPRCNQKPQKARHFRL